MSSISMAAKEAWTRLLKESGTTGHVKLISGYGAVDFVTGTRSADTLTETSLTAIVVDYAEDEIGSELVQENDLKVTIDGSAIITKKDEIKVGSDTYRIVNIRRINIDGVLIGYVLQVRL